MRLIDYLRAKRMKQNDLAFTLGLSEAHISMILSGKRWPSRKVARRIVELTEGKVGLEDLMED